VCFRFCGDNTQLLPYRRGPPCCLFVHRESIHVFSRTWQLVSYTDFCKSACARAKCKVAWICTCTICAQKWIINTFDTGDTQCNLQNSRLKLQYLIFFMQTLIKENMQNQKKQFQQDYTRMVIIGWCIGNIIWWSNPTPCVTAYTLHSTIGLSRVIINLWFWVFF
jgi:hypothetical protein